MSNNFDDIDNEKVACFIEGHLSDKEQINVTNTLRTYRDLWLLSNLFLSQKSNSSGGE